MDSYDENSSHPTERLTKILSFIDNETVLRFCQIYVFYCGSEALRINIERLEQNENNIKNVFIKWVTDFNIYLTNIGQKPFMLEVSTIDIGISTKVDTAVMDTVKRVYLIFKNVRSVRYLLDIAGNILERSEDVSTIEGRKELIRAYAMLLRASELDPNNRQLNELIKKHDEFKLLRTENKGITIWRKLVRIFSNDIEQNNPALKTA